MYKNLRQFNNEKEMLNKFSSLKFIKNNCNRKAFFNDNDKKIAIGMYIKKDMYLFVSSTKEKLYQENL